MEWYWIVLIAYFSISLYFVLIEMASYCILLANDKVSKAKISFIEMYVKRFLFGLLIFILFPVVYPIFIILKYRKKQKEKAY